MKELNWHHVFGNVQRNRLRDCVLLSCHTQSNVKMIAPHVVSFFAVALLQNRCWSSRGKKVSKDSRRMAPFGKLAPLLFAAMLVEEVQVSVQISN